MMLQKKGKASLSKALFQVAVSSAIIIVAGIVIQSCGKRTNDGAGASLREAEYIAQDSIRKTADVMPAFKGGSGEMYKFLSKELRYPQYARDNKIEGRVLVKFIVSPKGRIIDAEVVRSPDSSLSREALAVVKGMPDWEPAHMNDGRTVPVEFVLPVAFKLN